MPDIPETPDPAIPPQDTPLSLREQSQALGDMLKSISEADPFGIPSASADAAFTSWVQEVGPGSRRPGYFTDVLENYRVPDNSNRDLFDLFDLLGKYVDFEEEEEPQKAFIGLPMLGAILG